MLVEFYNLYREELMQQEEKWSWGFRKVFSIAEVRGNKVGSFEVREKWHIVNCKDLFFCVLDSTEQNNKEQ